MPRNRTKKRPERRLQVQVGYMRLMADGGRLELEPLDSGNDADKALVDLVGQLIGPAPGGEPFPQKRLVALLEDAKEDPPILAAEHHEGEFNSEDIVRALKWYIEAHGAIPKGGHTIATVTLHSRSTFRLDPTKPRRGLTTPPENTDTEEVIPLQKEAPAPSLEGLTLSPVGGLVAAVRAVAERFGQADSDERLALLTEDIGPAVVNLVGLVRDASNQPEPRIATAASRCLSQVSTEKQDKSERRVLTVKQAAEFLRKSIPLVQRLALQGRIGEKNGEQYLFSTAELERFKKQPRPPGKPIHIRR